MTRPFAIEPSASVFRAVENGDNAVSPASASNIIFDAYGPKVHGVSLSGSVPFSSFSASTSAPTPGGASSASYRGYQVTFPQPLAYAPWVYMLYKNGSGVWVPSYSDDQTHGVNVGGIIVPNGSVGDARTIVTSSYLFMMFFITNFPNPHSVTPPTDFAYRLFGV